MALCLQLLGDTVVMAPTSPTQMRGAIDSSMEAQGPLFPDQPDPIGAGRPTLTAPPQTPPLSLRTATGLTPQVRAPPVVLAASHGLTDSHDASVVLPLLIETADARLQLGP